MSDLAKTIALVRIEAEASKTDLVSVGADDLIAILDAAEAWMRCDALMIDNLELQAVKDRVRDAALEEAAAIADRIDTKDKPGWQVSEEIEIAIRALKEKPNA